jgi:hypothetical protein
MGGASSAYGGEERCVQLLVEKRDGNRPMRRPRSRCEDNIKMDLREVECESMDWIDYLIT